MNLKAAANRAKTFANQLEKKAQDIRKVDNNPLFDTDPRDNFVSVKSDGWSYQGTYDNKANVVSFKSETLTKYEADGVEDIPAESFSISTNESGEKTYQQTKLVSHEGCVEYFREDSVKAVIDPQGDALVYDKKDYGHSLAFLPFNS